MNEHLNNIYQSFKYSFKIYSVEHAPNSSDDETLIFNSTYITYVWYVLDLLEKYKYIYWYGRNQEYKIKFYVPVEWWPERLDQIALKCNLCGQKNMNNICLNCEQRKSPMYFAGKYITEFKYKHISLTNVRSRADLVGLGYSRPPLADSGAFLINIYFPCPTHLGG